MIVSTPIAVLPVARSPMISSRWPRPTANKASTTRMPVSIGSDTRSRSIIAGAGRSTGISASAFTGSSRSSGRPSGSTMRPSRPGPTGTRTTSPVPVTREPASMASPSSSSTAPIESASRVSANPIRPPSNRKSSLRQASGRPETRAIPSPTRSHATDRLGLRREIDPGDGLATAREPRVVEGVRQRLCHGEPTRI